MKGWAYKVSCSSRKVGGKTWRSFWHSVKNAQFHPTKHLSQWVPKLEAEWYSTPSIFSAHLNFRLFVPGGQARVRKSKNFPDSKIFHAKTFRIKRVNRDTFAFATKVLKTREFHVFFANVHNVELNGVWFIWWLSGLSRKFLYYPDSLWIVRTVSRLSGQSLDCPDIF